MPDLSEVLATHRGSGYVVAPAGFGKTYLIAEAVSHSEGRQLVLTHTYAGVNALRRKMRELRVPDHSCSVDTIASWALRLSLSYAGTSCWSVQRPVDGQWKELYGACSTLLESEFINRILKATYAGLYVDEYQDCSVAQHELVLKLARNLPCRVLGDPLQAIFDFDGNPVDWERDVSTTFEHLGRLYTPHRWVNAGTPEIGAWLEIVRRQLEKKQPLSLTQGLPPGVTFKHATDATDLGRVQGNACRYFKCKPRDSVIAIHKGNRQYKTKCHSLARSLGGKFSSIEEIEGKDLFSLLEKIHRAPTSQKRLMAVLEFAEKCMTAVSVNLSAATKRGERVEIRANTPNPCVAKAANAYLAEGSSPSMLTLLTAIRGINGVEVIRADLLNRFLGVLRKHVLCPLLTIDEAAEKYQAEFRYIGRPVCGKLIGTTLLVKGLEYDHAIILDAESLSRKELYVALTRGSKSVMILSSSATLPTVD